MIYKKYVQCTFILGTRHEFLQTNRKVRFLAVRNKNNRGVVRGVSVSLQSRAFLISPRLQSLFTTYCWRGLV